MAASSATGMVVSIKNGAATYVPVLGLRNRGIEINRETVDVTNADSAGMWRESLPASGVKSATISGDGVFNDDTGVEEVRACLFDGSIRDMKILVPGFGTFEGKFLVSKFGVAGVYNGEVTQSFTFDSAGALAFTVI